MHANIRRIGLFYRYLLSYILILVIPIIVMGMMVYGNFIKTLEREVEAANINMLSQVQSTVDMHLEELEYLVIRMETNPRLTPYMITKNGYKSYEAIQEIKNYKAMAGSFVYEVCLFLKEGDTLYSSSGLYSVYNFLNYVYQFENWDEDQLYGDFNIKGMSFLRPREKVKINGAEKSLITYILPLPTKSSIPYGSVMFIMDELVFTNMIGDILKDYKGYVYVLDDKDRIITSIGNEEEIWQKDVAVFLPDNTTGQSQVFATKVDDRKFSVSYIQSHYNGWKYVTIMPSAQFFNKVVHTRMLMWGAILLIAMVGGVLAITLSMSNYKPIKRLTDYAAGKASFDSKEGEGDELGFIAQSMDAMAATNERLKNQLTVQRPIIKEQLLSMLLKGEDHQWDELVGLSYMNFPYPYFMVLLVAPRQSLVISEVAGYKDRLMKVIGEFSFDGGNGYGVELIHDDAVAIIVNGEARLTDRMGQEGVAQKLQQLIMEAMGVSTIIGVGGVYEGNLRLIHRSFVEASAAMDYKLLKGKEGIIFFYDITHAGVKGARYSYPIEEEIRLSQSLKQGDANMFMMTLEEIQRKVEIQQASIYEVQCIYFDVINTIIKTVNNLNISTSDFQDEWNDILATMSSGTIDELTGRLTEICQLICREVAQSKESRNTRLRGDIIAYVQDHYQKCSFSLEVIADRFGMSSSYISRFFKDQTGETLAEYLNRLRLDAAKKLLVDTEKSIKEIVVEVGCLDDTSFIRKFKRAEGVTPGQYRNLHSKMETSIT